jgi:hypothetical protein
MRSRTALPILSIGAIAVLSNCVPPDEVDPAGEEIAATTQALGNWFDVGVIPNGTTCPVGVYGEIYMDTEDSGVWNWWSGSSVPFTTFSGWIGGWTVGSNNGGVAMRYCRVDGTQFKSITTDPNDSSKFYMVLKMGSQCPNGSVNVQRYFDNEDSGNNNHVYGDVQPNLGNGNTTLNFCLFRSAQNGAPVATDFPIFQNMPYGVFGVPNSKSLASGSVTTDDENDGNANRYTSEDPNGLLQAQKIVVPLNGGRDTQMKLIRVR